MFTLLKTPFWWWYCKNSWRFMLKHPALERLLHRFADTRFSSFLIRFFAVRIHTAKDFLAWYDQAKPDFILCTNFLGGAIITEIVKKAELRVPVFIYAADVFNNPVTGFNTKTDRIFISSELGVQNLLKQGYSNDQVKLCPFPLQSSIQTMKQLSREEARTKLCLEDRFTVLLNLGGEGIGSATLLRKIVKARLDWQVVVVGNFSNKRKAQLERIASKSPRLRFVAPGFVSNIGEYILASNVQAGKAGANALMESLALKRPFLLNDLLYAARDTKTFFTMYRVGWVLRLPARQLKVLMEFAQSKALQQTLQERLEHLPLVFDSDAFALQLIEEARSLAE